MRDVMYEDAVAAHLLHVDVETIRRRCRRGDVPGARRQRRGRSVVWLVPVSWLGPAYRRSL